MHRARTMMPLAPRARVVPRTTGALKSRAVECHGFASTEIIQGRSLVGIICEAPDPNATVKASRTSWVMTIFRT